MFHTVEQIRAHLKNVLPPAQNHANEENHDNERLTGAGSSPEDEDGNMDSDIDNVDDENTPEDRPNLSQNDLANVERMYAKITDDSRTKDPYSQSEGTKVFENDVFKLFVKSAEHKKSSKYNLSDHLYKVTVEEKTGEPALLLDIEEPLREALVKILDKLKTVYNKDNHHQVYLTIIEKNILNGLNSGNYALNAPSKKIANWVCSMLYNYLKSKQTLTLNDSFNVKIKVLGVKHILDLMNDKKRKKPFQPHIYH